MNQNKNKQYIKTHHYLQLFLTELMQTKKLSAISVKEPCELAKFKQAGTTVPLSRESFVSFFTFIKENKKSSDYRIIAVFTFPLMKGQMK